MFINLFKCRLFSSITMYNKSCIDGRNRWLYDNFSRSFLNFLFSLNTSFVASSRICSGKFSGTFFTFFVWPTIINYETFILIVFGLINSVFFLTCFDNFFSITFDKKVLDFIINKFLLLNGILSIYTVMNLTKNIILKDLWMRLLRCKIIKFSCRRFGVCRRRLVILGVESLKMKRLLLNWLIMRKFFFDKPNLIAFDLFRQFWL